LNTPIVLDNNNKINLEEDKFDYKEIKEEYEIEEIEEEKKIVKEKDKDKENEIENEKEKEKEKENETKKNNHKYLLKNYYLLSLLIGTFAIGVSYYFKKN
jgi:hypothetical protein